MTEQKMLIGSLSSDLYRIASLINRGSERAADRFITEAKRWLQDLKQYQDLKKYIKKILADLDNNLLNSPNNMAKAEKCLMYSVLLQNYALKSLN